MTASGAAKALAPPFRSSIAQLLEAPEFVALVPRLPPETLHALVRHGGLEACGDLIAAATPAQLMSVLDLDLWRHAHVGQDDQFDAHRFGEWLELLAETGARVSARIVAGLDQDLVVAGLSRHIRVFDPAAIARPASIEDDEPGDAGAIPHDGPECEIGGYLVRGTGSGPWDAIVALLGALGDDYPDCFHAVMCACRRLSNSTPEVDGLDDLLTVPEQLLHDVAVDRSSRRTQQGYSTPADARAFLQMARQRARLAPDAVPSTNPIAAAYFRAANTASDDHDVAVVAAPAPDSSVAPSSDHKTLEAIAGLLADAGLLPERPLALLEGHASEQSPATCVRRLMDYAREHEENTYFTRSHELAFLTNTLIAGCAVQSRPFTPQEASEAVVGICNLALEHWPARWPRSGTPAARERSATRYLTHFC